jgi:hypothetical protein
MQSNPHASLGSEQAEVDAVRDQPVTSITLATAKGIAMQAFVVGKRHASRKRPWHNATSTFS